MALNGMLILDHDMLDYMDRLAPEMGVLDLGAARRFSGNIQLPPEPVSTFAAWIDETDALLDQLAA